MYQSHYFDSVFFSFSFSVKECPQWMWAQMEWFMSLHAVPNSLFRRLGLIWSEQRFFHSTFHSWPALHVIYNCRKQTLKPVDDKNCAELWVVRTLGTLGEAHAVFDILSIHKRVLLRFRRTTHPRFLPGPSQCFAQELLHLACTGEQNKPLGCQRL